MPATFLQTARMLSGKPGEFKIEFGYFPKPVPPTSWVPCSARCDVDESRTFWFKNGMVQRFHDDGTMIIWDVRPTLDMAVNAPAMGGFYQFNLRDDHVKWKGPAGRMLSAGELHERSDVNVHYTDVQEFDKPTETEYEVEECECKHCIEFADKQQ